MSDERPVLDAITAYLAMGGLFNPEMAKHDRVRDLIMSARNEIIRLEGEVIQWKGYAETLQGIIEQKQPNLNPVPVLAEPQRMINNTVVIDGSCGEARESTKHVSRSHRIKSDSRSGIQKLFFGQTP